METIGDRIRHLRQENKFTLNELAQKVGISKTSLVKYENGTTKNIKHGNIEKLATLFNVSVDYLINGKEEDTEEDKLIKLLIQKTLDKKIEWMNFEEFETKEPVKVCGEDVTTEILKERFDTYIDNAILGSIIRLTFTDNNIFIFYYFIDIDDSKYSKLYFGTSKSIRMIENNKNLDNLYLAIYKPSSFVEPAKIESAITDLKNL